MKLIHLPAHTTATTGFTHKVIVNYTDLTGHSTAGTTSVILQIFPDTAAKTFAAGLCVLNCALNLTVPFVTAGGDGDATGLVVTVGDGGVVNRLMTSTELLLAGTEILFKAMGAVTAPYAYAEADTLDAVFTISGGTTPLISDCTAGQVEIYLAMCDLNDLEKVQ